MLTVFIILIKKIKNPKEIWRHFFWDLVEMKTDPSLRFFIRNNNHYNPSNFLDNLSKQDS